MTLQIGKKRWNSRDRLAPLKIRISAFKKSRYPAGFTLIELIIVATIIVVLVSISSPLFRTSFRDLELKDSAYNIGKLIKYGQQRAIVEERKYRLLIDSEKGAYCLFVESQKKEESEASTEKLTAAEGASVSGEGWERTNGRFGKYFYLPEGVKFKTEEDGDKITFLPNGRCEKVSIYVINQRNKIIEIRTNGKAGYVEISEVKEE